MSRTIAKDKFNILFDRNTVSAFADAIGVNDDESGFRILSKQDNIENPELKENFVRRLGSICGGVKKGLDDYLLDSIEQSADPNLRNNDVTIDYIYMSDSRFKVCAILLAHRGECIEVPGWWTVRLICKKNEEYCAGQAARLLGMYMYAIKTKSVQPYGLLEVANNYKNIAGYCLYTRFGFEETTIKCRMFDWMAMASELSRITKEQIIETTKTGKQQIEDTGATMYCRELKTASRANRRPRPRSKFVTPRKTKKVEYTEPALPEPEPDESGAPGACIIL